MPAHLQAKRRTIVAMGARLTRSLQHNNNSGGNRRHRDHRTHRVKDVPKKKHDALWQRKKLTKYEQKEINEAIRDSLDDMLLQ